MGRCTSHPGIPVLVRLRTCFQSYMKTQCWIRSGMEITWSHIWHQEVPLIGRIQGELGQKTDFDNFCADKNVPLRLNDQQVFKNDFRFIAVSFPPTLPPPPPTWVVPPLTGTAVSWRSSNHIAAVPAWLARPGRLVGRKGSGRGCQRRARCAAHSVCMSLVGGLVPTRGGQCATRAAFGVAWCLVNGGRHLWVFSCEAKSRFFKNLAGYVPQSWCLIAANHENLSVHNWGAFLVSGEHKCSLILVISGDFLKMCY